MTPQQMDEDDNWWEFNTDDPTDEEIAQSDSEMLAFLGYPTKPRGRQKGSQGRSRGIPQ